LQLAGSAVSPPTSTTSQEAIREENITLVDSMLTRSVRRLDLGLPWWERISIFTSGHARHTCCAVREGVVVIGRYVTTVYV